MHFEETAIQTELRELTRKFAQKELAPLIEEDEHNETFRPEVIKKLGDLGLTGIPTPEEYGGAGLGYQEYICVIEELAAVNLGYAISVAVTGLPQLILSKFGTPEQKSEYIPR
ncbi:acyl-CoA dehydrogenase family protein, partial [Bdellovibrionota bacterium FG-2]